MLPVMGTEISGSSACTYRNAGFTGLRDGPEWAKEMRSWSIYVVFHQKEHNKDEPRETHPRKVSELVFRGYLSDTASRSLFPKAL